MEGAAFMTIQEFQTIEAHMLDKMKDSAHDRYHIDRVLHFALDIAGTEKGVDMDVLLAACLLHDIGREKQAENPALCHAQIGGEMAYQYLTQTGWSMGKAGHVKSCIASHRYRGDNAQESLEAKILFDADKLDVTGAIGVARTLIWRPDWRTAVSVGSGRGDCCGGNGCRKKFLLSGISLQAQKAV